MDTSIVRPETIPREVGGLLIRIYPSDAAYTTRIVEPLVEMIQIAAPGIIGALVLSVPVALLAAENITPSVVTLWLGKLIVTVSRSVNTIVWTLFFVVMFGSGLLVDAAVIMFCPVGFPGKLLGEEIEEIDFGQVEAVRVTGAFPVQVLLYGILLQVKPALVGLSIYRWDISIRDSTVLGFVGAGGIGVQLLQVVNAFVWQSVAIVSLVTFGVVVTTESPSAYTRTLVW